MKFKADKTKLTDAIINASKATSAHSSIPSLEGILINLTGDVITVTGYDLEMGIKNMIPVVSADEPGEIVLNAKLLAEMLRKMPAGQPITIDAEERKAVISSGEIQFTLLGVSGQDYPNIPEMNLETSFKIKENVLKSMIRQTIYAASQNDAKPALMGTYFEIKDNVLNTVCIDSARFALRREKIEYKDLDFVAPPKTMNELLRILSDEETGKDITVILDRNQLGFYRDDYMIISRVLDDSFLDYERFVNITSSTEAVVNARELAASLDRTLLLTERYKSPVKCNFDKNLLKVNCQTNIGSIKDKMQIKYSDMPMDIAFNGKYMMEALKNTECDEVKLMFTNPLSPIKIMPLQGDDFTFLVMPVKVKE